MATFTADGELKLLTLLFKSTGCRLCLATDADLTELTDDAYEQANLVTTMGSVADGSIQNSSEITFDTGAQTASWWFVIDNDDKKICYGPLPSPQTGTFRFQVGAIRFETISG